MRCSWLPPATALSLAIVFAVAVANAEDPIPVEQLRPVRIKKGQTTPTNPKLIDEEALKKADLPADNGEKLLGYLKQRTLSDADQGKITGIIKRFGADDFDERVKAMDEIESFGPAAVGPLKAAESDPDPEIAYRARHSLKKMEKVPHSAVAAAAVRAIVKLKPAGAAAALIGFLPLADDETVADAIRAALISLAVTGDKADPALITALSDNSPIRRSAAYVALIEGGPAGERIRIKDAYPKVREAVLNDPDAEARFTGLWSLIQTTREKEYLTELIALIPKLGRGRIWQLEDLLLQLAGEHPTGGRFLKTPESLAKASTAWQNWLKDKGAAIDLVKLTYKPRTLGLTDLIEMDYRGYGQGRVVSLGTDLKPKWTITGVNNPTDMKLAPNGNVWVVESNNNLLTERTKTGTIVTRRNVAQQPLNMDLLPDGGMVVICRNNIFEFDKDGKQIWSFARPMYDIMTGQRLENGETLVVTNAFQGVNSFRLDTKGADANKNATFGRVQNLQNMGSAGEDKIVICEFDKVAEYDLKTGKQTWKHVCNAPSSCQRLLNGNTLISLINENKVIEVDPSGEIVWDYQAQDGLRVGRAYRR